MEYQVHPFADLFPTIPQAEFKKLKADMEKNGQIEAIVLFDDFGVDVLLDGRNRLKACNELGIQCNARYWTPSEGNSPEEFIFSKNFHRRHLTADQRIALVHRWTAATAKKAARERQQLGAKTPTPGRTRKILAMAAQVSEHKARQLEAVAAKAPELLREVESGEMPLKVAVTLLPQEAEQTHPVSVWVSTVRPKKPKRTYLTPKKSAQYVVDQARDTIEFHMENSIRPEHVKEFRMIVATELTKFAVELRSATALKSREASG
jgi:ParB-like chromosome segregation protein Spo0J